MKLSEFDFKLAANRTALHPAENRDESRLMVVHKDTGKIEHKLFKDIIKYFNEDDVLILNDTKVFPARLYALAEKTGAKIEVFLLRELSDEQRLWDVLVDPARKIRIGNKLYFGDDDNLVAEVIDNTTSRGRTLRFLYDGSYDEFRKALFELGQTAGLMVIRAYHESRDDHHRNICLIPSSAHGTNPASAVMAGMKVVVTKANEEGNIDVEDLRAKAEQYFDRETNIMVVNQALKNKKRIIAVGTSSMKQL